MIPIAKNVIVTDEFDNQIGLTHPKRARGLIKNGRAEYVSDDRIRLLKGAHAPSANNDTEDFKMSNVINFNAGEFKFDQNCQSWNGDPAVHAGSRMFISDFSGENVQVFEIGDWNWTWSQIKCEKQLEPNTGYVFRFAVQGGVNNTGDGQSRFIIMQGKDWDNSLEYPLERSRFKPTLSKKSKDGFLRVYEIPFNSGESGNVTFIFNALHFVETIMPAKELEAYAELEDQTYDQLWQEIQQRFGGNMNGFQGNEEGCFLNLSGAVIKNSSMVKKLMDLAERGNYINLSGAVLGDDDDDDDDDDDEFEWDRLAAEADAKAEEYDKLAAEADEKWKNFNGDYVMVREKLKESYEHTRWLYESAPDGSPEKSALEATMNGLKTGLDSLVGTFE
ncbi:MAG: hypothetical protein HDT25_01935 [Ruminococcus sp.]|nr:hypothetical protein [Ruminococcus sp.]